MLGFFHTAAAHLETFEALVQAAQPGIPTRHTVREDLLESAARAGEVTDEITSAVQAEVGALVELGARVVVCTCSTLGDAAEATTTNGRATILRVDRPLAELLVENGRAIVIVAALPSAMTTAVALLHRIARERNASLQVRELPCFEAWPHFLAGNRAGYAQHVADAVEHGAAPGDQVMLAQASMAPALPLIERGDIEVATTPPLGIRAALDAYARFIG